MPAGVHHSGIAGSDGTVHMFLNWEGIHISPDPDTAGPVFSVNRTYEAIPCDVFSDFYAHAPEFLCYKGSGFFFFT